MTALEGTTTVSTPTPDPGGSTVTVTPTEAVPVTDHGTVRMVIGALAVYLLAVLVAQVVLELRDKSLPESVLTTGSVALGALGAMLTSVRSVKS